MRVIFFRLALLNTILFWIGNLIVLLTFILFNILLILQIFDLPFLFFRTGIAFLQGQKRFTLILAKLYDNRLDFLMNQQRSDRHQKILHEVLKVVFFLHVAKRNPKLRTLDIDRGLAEFRCGHRSDLLSVFIQFSGDDRWGDIAAWQFSFERFHNSLI